MPSQIRGGSGGAELHKIISVFQRNYDGDRLIRDEVVPGAEWVLAGEGVATRKYDGTCCRIQDGKFYKRFELKKGKQPPDGFESAQDPDPVTGDCPGWVEVIPGLPENKWHIAALRNFMEPFEDTHRIADGTFEAVGPHFQGNPEGFASDILVRHGVDSLSTCPRDFAGIRDYLRAKDIEGIVFHHPDGRMAKVKKKDYGMKRIPCQ